jgi:hypothetical protein
MADFKPSDVVLHVIPLVGTMRKAEIEFAAACLVRACVMLDDAWQAVPVKKLAALFQTDVEAGLQPMLSWSRQPFVRPAPALMVERGFAVWSDSDTGDAIAFTDQGIEALRRWVRKAAGHA